MTNESELILSPRAQEALNELRGVILQKYPTATFAVGHGHDDPGNIHLITTVDLDDPDEVLDLVMERLLQLQVEERVPVYVIPLRTPERVVAELQAEKQQGQARKFRSLPRLSRVPLPPR